MNNLNYTAHRNWRITLRPYICASIHAFGTVVTACKIQNGSIISFTQHQVDSCNNGLFMSGFWTLGIGVVAVKSQYTFFRVIYFKYLRWSCDLL